MALVPRIKDNDWVSVRQAITKLAGPKLGPKSTPTFADLTLTNLTASRLVYTDANKQLESVTDLTSWIAGTTNQITVTDDADGTVTLSLPEDYDTGATPTLGGLTIVNAITEFSTDGTLGGNSNSALPTEAAVKTYVDTGVGAGGHDHDTDTLQLDGVNSDGGAFSFTTTGAVTFNQSIASTSINLTDNTNLISVDGAIFLANSGTENVFMGEGITNGDESQKSVFIGYHAGYNNETSGEIPDYTESKGDRNVYIGQRAGAGETKLTGSVAATNGSDAIVGTNTLFDTEVVVGDIIRIEGWIDGEDYELFEVSTITDDTHLTVDSNYRSATDSGLEAIISRGGNRGSENIAIGALALVCNTIGYENTAVGDDALRNNTSGYNNVAIGNDALQYNTTGNSNVSVGNDNLYNNTTGDSNVGIGEQSLYTQTAANYNVVIGYQSGYLITTGGENVLIGYQAGYKQTTATHDVMVGYQCGYNDNGDTTVGDNVFLGYKCFYNNNGELNIGIGYEVGLNNTTVGETNSGDKNVYIGYHSGYGLTTATDNSGWSNLAVGYKTLEYNTTGYANMALGYAAAWQNTTGYYNFALGANALKNNQTGNANVAIGYASMENATASNNVGLGNQTLKEATGGQNVAIGTFTSLVLTSGINNVCIGYRVLRYNQTGSDNTIIGYNAGGSGQSSVSNFSDNTYRTLS